MKDSIVQNIAHKLFLTNIDALEYQLAEHELSLILNKKSDGYCLNGDKLVFSSYDDRDNYVAYHYFSEMGSDCVNEENIIILTAFSIWEKTLGGNTTVAGLFLSLYEDKLDIWQSLLMTERNSYAITSLADQFIQHTKNIDIQKLFHFFSAIYKGKNQYIGIYSSLEKKLSNTTQKCHEIINNIHSNIHLDTLQLYNIALFSLEKQNHTTAIDILIRDIERNNNILSPQSLWILGRIVEKSSNRYRSSEIVKVIKNTISSPIPEISDAAIQAAVDSVVKLPEIRIVIRKLLESNNQKLIEVLSLKIYITRQLASHSDFSLWLSCICKASINNDALSGNIFHTLSHLAKDESKHELLTDCIFIMMRNNSISEDSNKIESFIYTVINYPNLLNKLFTLTLIDENIGTTIFSRILAKYLLVHQSTHILEFCIETINNFTQQDIIFLVRRLLGFISNETQLTSLTLSLLKVKNAGNRTYSLVKDVIINEIAIDYPSYVRHEIKKRQDSIKGQKSKLIKLYSEMLTEIDNYFYSFTSLPKVKEFAPPSLLVHNFQKEKDKVMTRSNDLHKEESFLFKIASQITLKSGIGSFYYDDFNNKGYSKPSYLQNFSSSYSLPRRYVMDNVGYDISIAQFRCAKKGVV
ncbi:hypothetical protein [Yersinia enterocolitica]|uniref:hypothetical protein n=1 Tax=Yersinia enterocolitica TaxID=630 RepID=UPI0005E555E5|nr:hypothetical protein [Yersinia enterocolitica]UXD29867.1 hypothetical protein FORC066_2657 [Yersinia enterocolitica]CFQ95910.1 Uncharacterised protein [Yersinia enterocolitica]CNG05817.1 Uncharacterised protein [Yersinia enterocolitica]HDL8401529.1 hypothetical protein [Yersinia enterocolitica]HDM8456861.1 hypothetical protein [Yersinia enterocolitica]